MTRAGHFRFVGRFPLIFRTSHDCIPLISVAPALGAPSDTQRRILRVAEK